MQSLPAPFRPEGAVAIPARGLVVVSGEGPNGGAANDEFLGGGVWIYQGVQTEREVQSYPDNVLQGVSDALPFGALSSAVYNGVPGQLIATPDVAFSRQRIWTFQEDVEARRMRLGGELLLSDLAGNPLTGYDPEGIAVNPEGGFVLASEGIAQNGGAASGTCTTPDAKTRNRLLFFGADGGSRRATAAARASSTFRAARKRTP